jgi:hypothetical protein
MSLLGAIVGHVFFLLHLQHPFGFDGITNWYVYAVFTAVYEYCCEILGILATCFDAHLRHRQTEL